MSIFSASNTAVSNCSLVDTAVSVDLQCLKLPLELLYLVDTAVSVDLQCLKLPLELLYLVDTAVSVDLQCLKLQF